MTGSRKALSTISRNCVQDRAGDPEIRVIFAFDPTRAALLLLGGDKAGNWERWYKENIPLAVDYTSDEEE
ncbi:type II toxin-antitoxin system RelE/ParE family toxin [Microtetraspora malaysiensis]|uniref:type II toxin-antitoxin system RelE/ParE family toxin n=1 Tax=Microtetraspora malaysiensis TaxID=161358 RepID=UPI003D9154BB